MSKISAKQTVASNRSLDANIDELCIIALSSIFTIKDLDEKVEKILAAQNFEQLELAMSLQKGTFSFLKITKWNRYLRFVLESTLVYYASQRKEIILNDYYCQEIEKCRECNCDGDPLFRLEELYPTIANDNNLCSNDRCLLLDQIDMLIEAFYECECEECFYECECDIDDIL